VHANALMVRTAALVTAGHLGARDMLQLPVLLPGLRDLVLSQLPHYSERCVANTLHSAAALDMRDRELLTQLAEAAVARSVEMTPQAIANVSWAFARLRLPPPPRLQAALFDASVSVMGSFTPQELADVGWAVAVLHASPPPAWTHAWLAAAQAHLPRSSGRAVARILWAAARMDALPGDQWRATAWAAISQRLRGATPHSVSAMMWSACRLWAPAGGLAPAQLTALLQRMHSTLPTASAADVTVALQALAAAGAVLETEAQQDAAAALVQRAGRLLPGMGVQQAAQLLWASARLRLHPGNKLLHRAATKLFYGIAAARAPDLSMGLWGLARLGLAPPLGWASVIFAQVQALARDFKPAEVVALLAALAELQLAPSPAVLATLLGDQRSAEQQLSAYSPRNLAMLAHALARLHQVHSAHWLARETQRLKQQDQAQDRAASAEQEESDYQEQQRHELDEQQADAVAVEDQAASQTQQQQQQARPSLPMAGAPRALREELLHSSFHRLGSMSGRDLSTLVWALVEMQLDPPPAWLYSCVATCTAQLPTMSAPDIAMLVRALQRHNAAAGLTRVDEFVELALARLGRLEAHSGAYTLGRVDALMRMAPPAITSVAAAHSSGTGLQQPRRAKKQRAPQTTSPLGPEPPSSITAAAANDSSGSSNNGALGRKPSSSSSSSSSKKQQGRGSKGGASRLPAGAHTQLLDEADPGIKMDEWAAAAGLNGVNVNGAVTHDTRKNDSSSDEPSGDSSGDQGEPGRLLAAGMS